MKIVFLIHSITMSPTENPKTEKNSNFQAWLKQTTDVILNAEKAQLHEIQKRFQSLLYQAWTKHTSDVLLNADMTKLDEIQSRLQSLLKRICSHSDCHSQETKLYYCSHCKCTHPVCNEHFKYVNQRMCLVCNKLAISRRWSTPYPKF